MWSGCVRFIAPPPIFKSWSRHLQNPKKCCWGLQKENCYPKRTLQDLKNPQEACSFLKSFLFPEIVEVVTLFDWSGPVSFLFPGVLLQSRNKHTFTKSHFKSPSYKCDKTEKNHLTKTIRSKDQFRPSEWKVTIKHAKAIPVLPFLRTSQPSV